MGDHCAAPCLAPSWLSDDGQPVIRCKKPPDHTGGHKDRLWTSDTTYLYVEWDDGQGPHHVEVGGGLRIPGVVPC